MKIKVIQVATAFIAFLLCSCQPKESLRGNPVICDKYGSFVVGKTTIQDVLKNCGSPSLCHGNSVLIYIGYKSEEVSFQDVKLKDRFTVRMEFDTEGILKSIQKADEKGMSNVGLDEDVTGLTTDAEALSTLKKIR
ncbi:MAG: hypothetical protein LBT70_00215 [Holosporaceae bacterium]|jgi:outer membrane protein assembly factor BamE (lipoprotein component of BamABCDE complex)|nr:hypothetical protein [Holosporaceae bacterium]